MSKRPTNREKLLLKFQQMTDSEIEDLLAYVSLKERTSYRDQSVQANQLNSLMNEDELLVTLSGAYENRRALQVFEWETARRKAEVRVEISIH